MKIISRQYGYYMYLLIFKERAFLSFECACIGAAADLFSRKSFNMKRRQKTMLAFLFNCQEVSKTNK